MSVLLLRRFLPDVEADQTSYAAWRRRQGPAAAGYPQTFSVAVALVTAFADPLLSGEADARTWHADRGAWS